jgi:hypothetical protein
MSPDRSIVILERAKGFEQPTPTLARSCSCMWIPSLLRGGGACVHGLLRQDRHSIQIRMRTGHWRASGSRCKIVARLKVDRDWTGQIETADQNSNTESIVCGRSSMAERQLPKLHTRVRFPSPAPAFSQSLRDGFAGGFAESVHPLSSSFLIIALMAAVRST